MKNLYIGTSGYNYRSWRDIFYPKEIPAKNWLSFYATQLNSVEINNSFYTIVTESTYQKWYNQTPPDFSFVIKGHRYITQLKKLYGVKDSVDIFFKGVYFLKEKLKCVLWQFPSSFVYRDEYYSRLESFLKLLPLQYQYAFEFREEKWFSLDILKLLEKYNATLVIAQSLTFPEIELPGNRLTYIRFHGPGALYSSGYSDSELEIWATKIKLYNQKNDTYVFFNNDAQGHAIDNIFKLRKLLDSGN